MPIATRPATVTGHRCGRRRPWVRAGVAAEHSGSYEPAAASPPGGAVRGARREAGVADELSPRVPFGLPVLAELPDLAGVLDDLAVADGAQRSAVARLADLLRRDEVERTTGVGVDHWLAVVAQLTRMDRRLLVGTARLLHRLPTLDDAVRRGRVSFAQLRGVALALRGVSRELDGQVDRLLAALLDGLEGLECPDPDVLVRQLADAVDELDPADLTAREREAAAGRFLTLQPTLDGTCGTVSGQLDAAGLALLDAATAPSLEQVVASGGVGPARADLLLQRLAEPCDHDRAAGSNDTTRAGSDAEHAGGNVRSRGRLDPARLLVRMRFESLLDPAVPAELLTELVGGRLKLTAAAARRLVDERGALLRTVVVDDTGAVIGVGRAARRPPGWLEDATLAVHDTCTGPGCDRPARTGQADHAVPWWPTAPDQLYGTTDVDNVGPLCDGTNREKEAAGWRVVQTGGGIRTWRHLRSGLTTTTVPSTWRPAGDPRTDRRTGPDDRHDGCRHRRRPAGTDPPGPSGPGPSDADGHRGSWPVDNGDRDVVLPF